MPTQVATDVYQQRLGHSKVLYFSESNLLLDSGPANERAALESFLEDRGDVDALFLSHSHGDHVGNAEWVIATYDPKVLIPENEHFDDIDLSGTEVTEVADGDELVDGVEVVEVPGHTEGICALYLPGEETLFATDILDGSDRRGLPAGYLVPPPARYTWDCDLAEANLEKLMDLSFDAAVVTHGTNVETDAHRKLDAFLNFDEYYRQDLLDELAEE